MPAPGIDFKYPAFISYSRNDFALASQLQRKLESYRLPGKVHCRWPPRGQRLYPVFRDSNELPASSDLGATLKAELARSAALVVICSPASAGSQWVNQEIQEFRSLGRGDRIYTVLAEGEPPACFPPALMKLRGEADASISTVSQPLAADMRPRQIRGGALRARLHQERLRLIAGLVGAAYEDLAQRDRKRTRFRRTVATVAVVVVLTASAFGFLWQRRLYEERIQKATIQELIDKGQRQLLAGDPLRALPYLSAAYSKGDSSRDLRFTLARAMAPLDARRLAISGILGGGFDPTGNSLLTVDQDGKVVLRDARTGKAKQSLNPRPDNLEGFEFDRDGCRLATISGDRVQLWNTNTGRLRATLTGHEYGVKSVRFSPTHHFLVTASVDNTARIWDSDSGRLLHILGGHSASVLHADISSDGTEVLTVSNDRTARLWNARTGRLLRQLDGEVALQFGKFSPDGERILLAGSVLSGAANVKLYQSNGKLVGSLSKPGLLAAVDFTPGGDKALAVVAEPGGKAFKVWSVPDDDVVYTLNGHTELAGSAWFSPDRRQLVTAGFDGAPRIWDTSTGSLRDILNIPPSGEPISRVVSFAEFSPHGADLMFLTGDNEMSLWNLAIMHRPLLGHSPGLFDIAYSPDGSRILSTDRDSALLWTAQGTLLARFEPSRGVLEARFDPSGQRILILSDTSAQLWSVASRKPLLSLDGHTEGIASAAFSPDGKRIATVGNDGLAFLWDADNGRRLVAVPKYPVRLSSVAFSPDGKRILLTAWDQSVSVWDANLRRRLCLLVKPRGIGAPSARFTPDGRFIVLGGEQPAVWSAGCQLVTSFRSQGDTIIAGLSPDGTRFVTTQMGGATAIRHTEDPTLNTTLQNYPILPNSARFSPDGHWVLLAGVEKADLWNADTGKLLFSFGGRAQVGRAVFSPQGDTIATVAADGGLELWNINLESRSPDQISRLVSLFSPWQLQQGVAFKRPMPS